MVRCIIFAFVLIFHSFPFFMVFNQKHRREHAIIQFNAVFLISGVINSQTVDKYVNNGFRFMYEFIDDLNPVLAGTKEIPHNVRAIHNYVINHTDVYVVASADELYNDMAKKEEVRRI